MIANARRYSAEPKSSPSPVVRDHRCFVVSGSLHTQPHTPEEEITKRPPPATLTEETSTSACRLGRRWLDWSP
jgi:hypothetical protein